MARTYGTPAEYLIKKASDKTMQILVGGCLLTLFLGFCAGLSVSGAGGRVAGVSLFGGMGMAFTFGFVVWFKRRALAWENERQQFRKGACGEAIVAHILSHLSDQFFVMHNIPTEYADYDHVVIGPTGIFVIETKDWRGLVTTDGLGELLRNGKGTGKPVIRNFIAAVMRLRNHACETTALDHFFQPLLVFTSADLKAEPGTTRNARCMTEDALFDYIENAKPAKPLPRAEAARITKCLYDFALKHGKAPHPSQAAPPVATHPPVPAA